MRSLGNSYVSDDGVYEIRSTYLNGVFAWRGRVIETDELVVSSADRSFVELRCKLHAMAAKAKTQAEVA